MDNVIIVFVFDLLQKNILILQTLKNFHAKKMLKFLDVSGEDQPPSQGGQGKSRYVPPHLRGRGGGDREQAPR